MHEHAINLLQQGNVRGAREFLEISASDGFADAAITLSLTYDEEALRKRGFPIELADETARSSWAQRASELGYQSTGNAVPTLPVVLVTSKGPSTAAAAPTPAAPPSREPSQRAGTTAFDGVYSSQAIATCGGALQSVFLTINRGTIAFEHVVKGVPYGWRGTVDAEGAITASVPGSAELRANGRFDENLINLIYP